MGGVTEKPPGRRIPSERGFTRRKAIRYVARQHGTVGADEQLFLYFIYAFQS
ncbi:hypothetical protein KCP73_26965 (plasmid) [Salmonella enterica subsp. enterica]|nr:hypothetical protein KCP73_26965 [Salmonella enterica subsp. enterica]